MYKTHHTDVTEEEQMWSRVLNSDLKNVKL